MELVYYSLAALGDSKYERQWVQSIRSLRAYNRTIPVHLVVYGDVSESILSEATRRGVAVHIPGSYADCVREFLPRHADLLVRYPTFHKLLSLRSLPICRASRVLYLDCDTFCFGDVAALFRRYQADHFYAREEPWSRRSHYGYSAAYFDEDRFRETAVREGLEFIAPYNTGICFLNHGLPQSLAAASSQFMSYAWRLLVGLCYDPPPGIDCGTAFLDSVRRVIRKSDIASRLAYPSSNWWILEEVAILLTLGGITGISHGKLLRNDALQNGEFAGHNGHRPPTLVHYYSQFESEFFTRVNRL